MAPSSQARIIGLGSYLPKQVLTNRDLEQMVETTDEWISSRTGIRERRIASDHEPPSTMGKIASERALKEAGVNADNLDLIIVATCTPDYPMPTTSSLIQRELKATNAATLDINTACTGYLYALSVSKAYLEAGLYKTILLVATEKMSSIMDYKDRSTCILFGDGASAAVLSREGEGLLVNTICLGSDGEQAELITVPAGGSRHPACAETVARREHFFKMEGKEVFRHAVRRMEAAAEQCLKKAGLEQNEISWLVPHQANLRIIDATAKRFHIPQERVWKTIDHYGNTSAASVGITLEELVHSQTIACGEHLLLVAFGAGLSWGAAILTKGSG